MLPRKALDPDPEVPMREYLERILDERDRLYGAKFAASEVAVAAALAAAEKAVNSAFLSQQTAMQTALVSQEKAVSAALAAAERAGTKAEIAADKRFEGLNELRGMVTDQQATFMQRGEATALINAINERLIVIQANYDSKLETLRVAIEKNADTHVRSENEMRLLISHLITNDAFEARHTDLQTQITSLRESRSESTGKSTGASALWGYIVGVVMGLIAVASVIIAILKP